MAMMKSKFQELDEVHREITRLRDQNRRLAAGAIQMTIAQNRARIEFLKARAARMQQEIP